jgi:hypothetical protein
VLLLITDGNVHLKLKVRRFNEYNTTIPQQQTIAATTQKHVTTPTKNCGHARKVILDGHF